ncbi:MAG: hypothetical protein AB1306_01070 [Nitrospirota bacterium]
MTPSYHVVASTAISAILFLIFRSWGLAIASFISGVFIDLDHVLDYIFEHGLPRDVKKFFHFFYGEKYKKLTLILHGWEWLFLMAIVSWLTGWPPWVTGLTIGWGQHMLFDRFYNISTFGSYSFFWRLKNGFDATKFLLKNRTKSGKYNRDL